MSATQPQLATGVGLALATSLVMSLAAVLIKLTADTLSIEMIVFFQYLLCTCAMLPWVLKRGIRCLATPRPFLHLLRGTCGWACFYTYYLALEQIPLVDAALLRNAAPLCVPIWLLLWHGARLPLLAWGPLLTGFAGIALIIQPEGVGLSGWHLVGVLSALTLAGSIVTTRALAQTEPTNRILFYYFLISTLASTPLALFNWRTPEPAALPLVALIALSIWITMWLYTRAYSHAPASIISPLSYFGVVMTGVWGWMIWDQVPDIKSLSGTLLVIIGGITSVWLGAKLQSRH
ncbi:DMT family transporter [Marinobacterium sp. AK62]|uniref:DMT family transporter n=1 Tax=Marinobacterium alkalitolerans TaxID=1542925 RepID=A0ABS3ZDJ2_9GAMM|nr:DMT family transporter [Marinobacterium alkalitolerans]MBP0049363.1 DMT family transporter [Marinobacterium alkalitolerans]